MSEGPSALNGRARQPARWGDTHGGSHDTARAGLHTQPWSWRISGSALELFDAGAARDRGAAYVILSGTGDQPADLLRGGEALSALPLRATADGLSTARLSDAVEAPWPRRLLRGLLAGIGEPFLSVRLGYRHDSEPVPAAPRRHPRDVITTT